MFIYSRAWQNVTCTSGFFLNSILTKNLFFPLFFFKNVKMFVSSSLSPLFWSLKARAQVSRGKMFKKRGALLLKRYFFTISFPLLIKVKHNQRNFSLALTKVTSKFFVPSFCFTKTRTNRTGQYLGTTFHRRRRSWSAGLCHRTNLFYSVQDRISTIGSFPTSGTFAIKTTSHRLASRCTDRKFACLRRRFL